MVFSPGCVALWRFRFFFNQRDAENNRQLWRRHHSLHHLHLFAFLSAQVAVVTQDEKGAEVRAAHERAAREIERHEAERSTYERVADGATALDEGSKPARRMFAFADSDAVFVCAL